MDAQQQEEEMASRSVQDGDDNIEAVTRSKEIEDILKCMRCTEKDAVVECRNCSPDQELGLAAFKSIDSFLPAHTLFSSY